MQALLQHVSRPFDRPGKRGSNARQTAGKQFLVSEIWNFGSAEWADGESFCLLGSCGIFKAFDLPGGLEDGGCPVSGSSCTGHSGVKHEA